jgi:hypothetical protein
MGKRTLPQVLWAIRQADGQIISCELLEDAQAFELVLCAGNERVSARRYLSRGSAELEAESMKERMVASVCGLLIRT